MSNMSYGKSSFMNAMATSIYDWSLNILRTIITKSKSSSSSSSLSETNSNLWLGWWSSITLLGSYMMYCMSMKYYNFRTSPLRNIPGPILTNNFWFGNILEIIAEPFMQPHLRWFQKEFNNDDSNNTSNATGTNGNDDDKKTKNNVPLIAYSGILGRISLIVLDPLIVRDILYDPTVSSNDIQYMKRYGWLKLLTGDGLVTLEGVDWSRHRRIIQPSFQTSVLEQTLNDVVPTLTNQLINSWIKASNHKADSSMATIIDVDTHLQALTLDIIGQAGFSYEFHALDAIENWANHHSGDDGILLRQNEQEQIKHYVVGTKEYNNTMKHIGSIQINHPFMHALNQRISISLFEIFLIALKTEWILPYVNPILSYKQYKLDKAAEQIVIEAKEKLILLQKQQQELNATANSTTSKMNNNNSKVLLNSSKSLLQLLLQASSESSLGSSSKTRNTLSLIELRDEVKTFLLAGHETTATWCYWALYKLSQYPDIQEKVYQDIILHSKASSSNNDDNDNNTINLQQVNEMEYLDAFLKEILRYHPPVGMVFRFTTKPLKWHNTIIPSNTRLIIPIYMLHHHPLYWGNDAHIFNPNRWLTAKNNNDKNNQQQDNIHQPYTFLPFSLGQRNCIGYKFAQMEGKLIIANIVHRLKILSPDCMPTDTTITGSGITLKSKPLVKIYLQER